MRNIKKMAILLVLGISIFASQAAYSMDKSVYEYFEEVAKKYAVHYADLEQVGLVRTAKTLFDTFGNYVQLCDPKESQLVKLERIFGRQKSNVNEDDMEKVEQKIGLPQAMLEANIAMLDLQIMIKSGACMQHAKKGTDWLKIGN